MKIIKNFTTKNPCYKNNVNRVDSRYTNFQKNGPKGLMLHSIGVGQNKASVIVNNFNQTNAGAAVHAVLQEDGTVIQCMPWNYRVWHCAGSANNTHVGVEMTEPNCIRYTGGATFKCSDLAKARAQVAGTYKTAVELFAYLCKMYNLNPLKDGVIISHAEGCKRGVASNHGDPEHLWKQLKTGYTMDGFRKDVKAAMSGIAVTKPTVSATTNTATPSTNVSSRPTLKQGSTGKYVKELQTALNSLGYNCGTVDGDFGAKTTAAVKKLQTAKKLTVDGIVGSKTWAAIDDVKDDDKSSSSKSYVVKVTANTLNVRKGPGTNYDVVTTIKNGGVYTIVEEENGFGKLKSGAGWISLDYVKKV